MISSIFDFALIAHHFVSLVVSGDNPLWKASLLIGALPVRLLFSREARLIPNNSGVSGSTTATYDTSVWGIYVSGCSLSGDKGKQNLYYRHANLMITPFFLLAGMAARGKSSVASSVETVQGRSTEEFTRLPGLPGLWNTIYPTQKP
jgi:hypothetical protein